MPVVQDFEPFVVDDNNVVPAERAAFFAASVLVQMLVEHRGEGPWIDEVHQNLRNSMDRHPPEDGWQGTEAEWRDAIAGELRMIFAHAHMVGSVRPKN